MVLPHLAAENLHISEILLMHLKTGWESACCTVPRSVFLDNHGKLDLEDEILKHLDYVIASLHRPAKRPGSKEENTRSYIEAMKNHMYESSDIVMM